MQSIPDPVLLTTAQNSIREIEGEHIRLSGQIWYVFRVKLEEISEVVEFFSNLESSAESRLINQ
jgi:hypothetical protein